MSRAIPRFAICSAFLLLLSGGSAGAADHPVLGRKLVMLAGSTAQRLTFTSKDTILAPTTGGADDPTLVGASVEIYNPISDETATLSMPAPGWTVNTSGTVYRFRDVAAPARVAIVKAGRLLKVVARSTGITLDEASQGSIGVAVTIGATTYCALFDGGSIRRDQPGRFIARNALQPGSCPGVSPGSTTTTLSGSTTTLSGSTTTLSGSTTTTTTLPPGSCCNGADFLVFSTVDAPGDCGDVRTHTGALFKDIACSGLYFGGGGNAVPLPATIPDLGVSTLSIDSCTGQTATLGATTTGDTGDIRTCSSAGCYFGAPLAIPNKKSAPTSVCVINTLSTAAAGALDCATGDTGIDLPLSSEVFLTGDLDPGTEGIQPCPRCASNTCISGPNDGQPCTPGTTALNAAYPTSHHCPPEPMLSLGALPIGFELSTGTVSWTATPATNDTEILPGQERVFAGFCRDESDSLSFASPAQKCWENGQPVGPPCAEPFETCAQRDQGAFGPAGGAVKTITAIGSPLEGLLGGPASGTLVSVFGVPPTFNATVDATGNLPGPGAAAIPGSAELCATVNPCVPPVVSTTTTLPGATTTTTTTATPPTTTSTSTTTTSTSTTTSTTLFAGCPPPANPLGATTFFTEIGSLDCGGPGINPPALAPFSGAVLNGNGDTIANLGAGCLYVGGGLANALPPARAPDGAEAVLNVAAVNGSALTLAASDGNGVINCTRGAGPARHCVNGEPGTDGMGACTTDADCGEGGGICLMDANCFFGPPIPLSPSTPALATCIVNAFASDVCGALDTAALTSSLDFALSTRLYLTQNPAAPCPRCLAGLCTAGARQGLPCSDGIGLESTSNECPPLPSQYVGQLLSNPIQVSTGSSQLVSDAQGNFCPGQRSPGALGTGGTARVVQQMGALSGAGALLSTRFAGNICAASSGNELVDSVQDLPGPISLSFSGALGVCLLPDFCGTLCNPCTLGPLCDTVCDPCLLCFP
jgi:hypothetical protein